MKRNRFVPSLQLIAVLIIGLTIMMSISNLSNAQTNMTSTYKGEYNSVTLVDSSATGADTSFVLQIPFGVDKAITYLVVDSVSTSDSLKSVICQASPDGSTGWVNTGYSFSDVTAAGNQRLVLAVLDKYIRFIYTVGGTDVSIPFKITLVPK